jgi:hypothetical protein
MSDTLLGITVLIYHGEEIGFFPYGKKTIIFLTPNGINNTYTSLPSVSVLCGGADL